MRNATRADTVCPTADGTRGQGPPKTMQWPGPGEDGFQLPVG